MKAWYAWKTCGSLSTWMWKERVARPARLLAVTVYFPPAASDTYSTVHNGSHHDYDITSSQLKLKSFSKVESKKDRHLGNVDVIAGLVVIHLHTQHTKVVVILGPGDGWTWLTSDLDKGNLVTTEH